MKKLNDKSKYSLLTLLLISLFTQFILNQKVIGQTGEDYETSRHIFFTKPLGFVLKDYSLGYEYKIRPDKSFTFILDAFQPWKNNYKIGDTPTELEVYKGLSMRFGIKKLYKSKLYNSIEFMYKISGYNNKLILRENYEGDYYDIYYLENRTCNSVGCAYKFGYEVNKNHLFFSPFFSIGLRIRYDNIKIKAKYNYLDTMISNKTEYATKTWRIPMLHIGFMIGFGL